MRVILLAPSSLARRRELEVAGRDDAVAKSSGLERS
jgi:hypothetical protein